MGGESREQPAPQAARDNADEVRQFARELGHSPFARVDLRIDRRIRELALEHAAGTLGDDTYLARLKALRQARDAIAKGSETGVPAQRAIEWLHALAESIQQADVPKERAELMHAIHDRITVAGPEIVGVRLTPSAHAHGFALALPEKVAVASPTGFGPAGTHPGFRHIPVEDAEDWEASCLRSA